VVPQKYWPPKQRTSSEYQGESLTPWKKGWSAKRLNRQRENHADGKSSYDHSALGGGQNLDLGKIGGKWGTRGMCSCGRSSEYRNKTHWPGRRTRDKYPRNQPKKTALYGKIIGDKTIPRQGGGPLVRVSVKRVKVSIYDKSTSKRLGGNIGLVAERSKRGTVLV